MMDAGRKNSAAVTFNGIADEQAKAEKEKAPKGPFDTLFDMLDEEDVKQLDDMNGVLRTLHTRSLKEVLSDRFETVYAQGCDIIGTSEDGFSDVVKAANESDVVVMALGGNCGWVNVTGGEGKDRQSLELPGVQEKLLETVAATGKPVVLVLYGPGIFSVNWAVENIAGIVQAWMPGPFAGEAVTNVLDGSFNPGGKLNVTIPRSAGQIPIFYNHKNGSGYASGSDATSAAIFSGGYTDGLGTPLYPFGYGLSYTEFALDHFKIEKTEIPTDGKIEVSCTVSNTGAVAGDEVVQLYQAFHGAHVVRPNKQLAGFKRVHLNAGETKKITFNLDTAQLGYYDEEMQFVVEPGQLDIMVGTSSEDLPFKETINLIGEKICIAGKRSYTCEVEEK